METKEFCFEVKELAEEGEFEGYASTFGNVDLGGDKVVEGAFKKSLKRTGGKVPILADHSLRSQIGWNLSAEEDSKGLKVRGRLDLGVQTAREKWSLAKMAKEIGARMGLSIGYDPVKTGWEGEVRLLKEVELHEYSLVTIPMNERAGVVDVKGARILAVEPETITKDVRKFENFLRDAGFSKHRARYVASMAFRRDAEVREALDRAIKALKT